MARNRADDFDDKARAILRAAAAVLADEGGRASMARIARRAGVSKALLYHYHPSREALVTAIIETHLTALDAALAAADDPAAPPDRRLRVLVGTVLHAYRDADDAHRVQLAALPALPRADRDRLAALQRGIVRRLGGVLQALAPDLHPARLTAVTMSLFGMLNWAYMWFRDTGHLSRADYADLATDLVLRGLPGLAPAGPGL